MDDQNLLPLPDVFQEGVAYTGGTVEGRGVAPPEEDRNKKGD